MQDIMLENSNDSEKLYKNSPKVKQINSIVKIYQYFNGQTTQRTQMESELSVLIIFTFEEQSCLILDSISNPVFIIQILHFICRFHILGLLDFLWIELNEHSSGLN